MSCSYGPQNTVEYSTLICHAWPNEYTTLVSLVWVHGTAYNTLFKEEKHPREVGCYQISQKSQGGGGNAIAIYVVAAMRVEKIL